MKLTVEGVEYVDLKEAALLVGRSLKTLRWYSDTKKLLPDLRADGRIYFKPETVRAVFGNLRGPKVGRKLRGYYTVNEVARALKTPVAEIRRRLDAGELTPDRTEADGRVLFSKATLDGLKAQPSDNAEVNRREPKQE